MKLKNVLFLSSIVLVSLFLAGCGDEIFGWKYGTVVAPPAQTVAAQGGQFAQTQAARLLQTAQGKIATESAELKETAKVEAATIAAGLIDTAQARLVTQSAGQVTVAPTQIVEFKETAGSVLQTQAAERFPMIQTEAANLQATSEARLATAAVQDFPLSMTQAAGFYQTLQAVVGIKTAVPLDTGASQGDQAATSAAFFNSQNTPQVPTPIPPAAERGPREIIIYQTRPGDQLHQIASQLGISVDKIIFLNQLRYPGLTSGVEALPAGLSLVIASQPDESGPAPSINQDPWSNTPGCYVPKVDWLPSPLECLPAKIDIVSRVEMTAACISLSNPLGYTQTHEVLDGWMLRGADDSISYGWFIDQARGVIVVGPAIVAAATTYPECQAPGR